MADDPADVLYRLARQLKTTNKELRKQFLKEMRAVAKPLLPAVRASAAARFPTKGGLNRHMARGARYRTVAKTGLTTAGVSIRANRTDPRVDTQGRIAHPIPDGRGGFLLNDKGKRLMVVQHLPKAVGFFADPIEAQAGPIRDALAQRLERWAAGQFTE